MSTSKHHHKAGTPHIIETSGPDLSHGHDLIPAKDAARYLRLSSSTMAKLRVYGGGPAYFKLRRRIYYDVADLDEWISCRRLESTSDRSK